MLTITTWLWDQPGFRYKYTENHVLTLKSMLERNTTAPFNFVCFSDREIEGVQTHPFQKLGLKSSKWSEYDQPQCFNRLWLFSEEAREVVGDRFVNIDLDVVILDNIDSILTRKEEFLIAAGNSKRNGYNGSLWMMDTGVRRSVWDDLTQERVGLACNRYVGSDQAWMRYKLGWGEKMLTEEDGVYSYHYSKRRFNMKNSPPEGCKIMFFAGREKIDHLNYKWIEDAYF